MTTLSDKLSNKNSPVDTAPHLIVEARAGTGKTTTLVEGLKRVKGLPTHLTPSPQQAAVWDEMEQSSENARTICFCCFNKSIQLELKNRVPPGCDAMTMHSMGLKAVSRALGKFEIEGYRVSNIISDLLAKPIRQLRREKKEVISATQSLVSLAKMNLSDNLPELAAHYDIDLNGNSDEVFDLVRRVLERCKDVDRDGQIDFDDMIWLPVVLDLPVFKYDLLLVDEAQDLNRCQQQLALKAGRRLVLCGDPKQAIYGFAGADSESMSRMEQTLGDTLRGVVTLPLTVTYRCGKAIVEEARKIVPDFSAHESNGDGKVDRATFKSAKGSYHETVGNEDMILCRVNAPLVSECFKFIKAGRKANIQGRDIGDGLISTINRMKARDVVHLVEKLDDWYNSEVRKENAKRNPSEGRLMGLGDRHSCLMCFTEGANTIEDVIAKINEIFTNDKHGTGIMLSSVHKAKGLEADCVFLLMPEGASIPHPMARTPWQREQEMNIKYVAVTRAIKTLVFVS